MTQILEIPKEQKLIWDKPVPIIDEGGTITAFLTDEIQEAFVYNELCHILYTADDQTSITLHINTPGGYLDAAFMLVDAIKSSKATITANLTGTVASAGTIIALSCDKLVVADHTSFMIHNYSSGMQGKGGELKAKQKHTEASLATAFSEFYGGFLTPSEIEDVIDDKDMWMGKEEVLRRWQDKLAFNA